MESSTNPQPSPASPLRPIPNQPGLIKKLLPLIITVLILTGGAYTGLLFSNKNKLKSQTKSAIEQESLSPEQKQSFSQTFRDQAEGVVERNDKLDKYAQGTHRLVRPGGDSQTAFLTSTVMDLDEYVGKKVKIYGETFGSSQVGWLMDVGKVEVSK